MLSSKALRLTQFQALVVDPQRPRVMWVMEACGGAYHWGRQLLAQSDQAKLVPPKFVAKQRVGKKYDANDANSIFAVHMDTRVHPAPVKSATQQSQLAFHTAHKQYVKTHTAMSNHLRSLLAKNGHVTSKGTASLDALVCDLVNSACPKLNSKRAMQQQANPETAKSDDLHVFARNLRARKPRHVW